MIAARDVVAKHRTMPGGETADAAQSAPQILERLVAQAERAGASDIHLHMRGGPASVAFRLDRSEERRVGKECRSRWSPYH